MNKIKVIAITDIEHSAPRIPNLLSYFDSNKYDLYLIGANYSDYLTSEDLPEKFNRVKLSLFKRKINIFSSLKKNFEDSSILNNNEAKKSKFYLIIRRTIIKCLLFLSFPDQYFFTINNYINEFKKLKITGDILLISSSPYPTSHIAAYKIKNNSDMDIKWIADYRDLWSLNSNYSFNKLRFFFDRKYEQKIMKSADKIVTVSKPWAQKQASFLKRHIDVVPNGYTINKKRSEIISQLPGLENDKIYILYVGAIYFNSQDVLLFFESIENLNLENIEVHFIGNYSYELEYIINKRNLESNVKQIGKFSRNESQELQKKYDYLLFFDLKNDDGWILLKFYEYIGANKPIICIGGARQTAHKQILKKINRGEVLIDKEQIVNFFNTIRKDYQNQIYVEDSYQYSYQVQSKKMEKLIESLYKSQ